MARDKRRLSILDALYWALVNEQARLDFSETFLSANLPTKISPESQIFTMMDLGGVRIDTSHGTSYPHDDADLLVTELARIPHGKTVAIEIGRSAVTGRLPETMDGARPQVFPLSWKNRNQHGAEATEKLLRVTQVPFQQRHPKNPQRTVTRFKKFEEKICPIRWDPHPDTIEAARNFYTLWREGVIYMRNRFIHDIALETIEISRSLPPSLDAPRPRSAVPLATRAGGSRP